MDNKTSESESIFFNLLKNWICILFLALFLTACGGSVGGAGGGGGIHTETPPPDDDPDDPPENDDPEFDTAEYRSQWGLAAIGAAAAYSAGYFGQGVTVAVVDSGVLTTHTDISANIVGGIRFPGGSTLNIIDGDGHGTHVAGIIGASRNGSGIHGVAPSASIMPVQVGDADGNFVAGHEGLNYAIDNEDVHVINNSWGPVHAMYGTFRGQSISFDMPLTRAQLELRSSQKNAYTTYFGTIAKKAADRDAVIVFAGGNDAWHNGGNVTYCETETTHVNFCFDIDKKTTTPQDLLANFVAHAKLLSYDEGTIQTYADGTLSTLNIDSNSQGGYALAPFYEPSLLGKFAVVAALNEDNEIAFFSNACGDAKYWCIAAPGEEVNSLYNTGDSATEVLSGTSMAAPQLAGALAVMRSRLNTMPMSVALTIIFQTATDLGASGIDDIYGHGLLNLRDAIKEQNNAQLMIPDVDLVDGLLIHNNASLPPALYGLASQLDMPIAVQYLGDQYYNMPVGELFDSESVDLPQLGSAGQDVLNLHESVVEQPLLEKYGFHINQNGESGHLVGLGYRDEQVSWQYNLCNECKPELWSDFQFAQFTNQRPFFSQDEQDAMLQMSLSESLNVFVATGLGDDGTDETYQQWGLRWYDNVPTITPFTDAFVEYSHITEENNVLGGTFSGGLGMGESEIHQLRFALSMDLPSTWKLMGGYDWGYGQVNSIEGNLIEDMKYQYDGLRISAQGESIFDRRDRLHLMAKHQTGLRDGQLTINRSMLLNGELINQRNTINWKGEDVYSFHLGYAVDINEHSAWSIGFEHARGDSAGTNDAVSLGYRLSF